MKQIQKIRLENLPSLLKTSEVADLLGCSMLTVRRKTLRGVIKGYKLLEGRWRYKREDIWKYLNMESV